MAFWVLAHEASHHVLNIDIYIYIYIFFFFTLSGLIDCFVFFPMSDPNPGQR